MDTKYLKTAVLQEKQGLRRNENPAGESSYSQIKSPPVDKFEGPKVDGVKRSVVGISETKKDLEKILTHPEGMSAGLLLRGEDARDVISGVNLFGLMGRTLAANYPYFYATAFVHSDKGMKSGFFDGLELVKVLDEENDYSGKNLISVPCKAGTVSISDVTFFCAKEVGLAPRFVGGLDSLYSKGFSDLVLRALCAGIEHPSDTLNTNTSRMLASSLFRFGILMEKDTVYAKKLITKLSTHDIEEAVAECLAIIACSDLSELVAPLLEIGGKVDLPAQGDNFTPLMMAVSSKSLKVAQRLLEAGANPDHTIDGKSARDVANAQNIKDLF